MNSTKEYTVIAEDGTKNVYQINVLREGIAKVNNVNINQPKTFNDTDITVDITGQFIPYLRDDEVRIQWRLLQYLAVTEKLKR